jgi:WD40 repeat protein
VKALELVRTINLPTDLAGGVTTFVWSPSSRRVLVSVTDQIHVFSAEAGDYHAVIRNPGLAAGKSSFVDFGANDDELCVFSPYGIKLSLYHLQRSKAIEIANPKFFSVLSASRGLSYRASTQHLALLTRTQGKDSISIHTPDSREVQRSWIPDTIDAAGIAWTPDGKWLAVWESAAHGHRIVLYTPDGNVFRDWRGPPVRNDNLEGLGAGVRCVALSPSGECAVATDFGRSISILSLRSAKETRLHHPISIDPKDTMQVCAKSLLYLAELRLRITDLAGARLSQQQWQPVMRIREDDSTDRSHPIINSRTGIQNRLRPCNIRCLIHAVGNEAGRGTKHGFHMGRFHVGAACCPTL